MAKGGNTVVESEMDIVLVVVVFEEVAAYAAMAPDQPVHEE